MKKIIKSTALSLCLTLAVSAMCGCGNVPQNVVEDQSVELNEEQDIEQIEDKNTEGNTYGAIYLDKINELKSEGLADQFALVNIDGDDVPELIASDSEGSFDHENAFIFTISNDKAIQLAAVITGVDGGNLDYAEGANLIHVSGAAAGMRDVFSRIKDGKLEEVFSAEATSMDEDANYSINGNNVKENEYYEQINGFIKTYDPLTRIAYDGLYEISYEYENGYGCFEESGSKKYGSYDEVVKELEAIP